MKISSRKTIDLNEIHRKVLSYLVDRLKARKSKWYLFVFPDLGHISKDLNLSSHNIMESIKFLIDEGLIHGQDRTSIEFSDGIYLLQEEDLEELKFNNRVISSNNPDEIIESASSKVRHVFILEPMSTIEVFELILDELYDQPTSTRDTSFQNWIKSYEDRYSEQELFLMRWIWEIRSETK